MTKNKFYCAHCGKQLVEVEKVLCQYNINTGRPKYAYWFECPDFKDTSRLQKSFDIWPKHDRRYIPEEDIGEEGFVFPSMIVESSKQPCSCDHCGTPFDSWEKSCEQCGAPLRTEL
ncbi:MAG: hypothetical protein WC998_01415 [Candidatus Paceibacterota bacterium]|jgi:hypothetical protein